MFDANSQNLIALLIVGLAVGYLARTGFRAFFSHKKSGCGACSSCPSAKSDSSDDLVTLEMPRQR